MAACSMAVEGRKQVEEEAQEIADKHGDDRRTALVYDGASPRPLACPPSHAELARSL